MKKIRTFVRMNTKLFSMALAVFFAVAAPLVGAQSVADFQVSAIANGSTGDFAPYFIGSLNGGRIVRKGSVQLDAGFSVVMDTAKRVSWGMGAEVVVGYSSKNTYDRWNADAAAWGKSSYRPSIAWIQQLYGEVKYRSVFLRIGQKDSHSALLDESLSSGDLVRSANARGIPGFEVGFIDFQDIPYTRGWLQIQGQVEYGAFSDDNFRESQFNYYNYVLARDLWYTYKRCYFRTKPSEAFSVTLGMQTAGQFAGSTRKYSQGRLTMSENRGFNIKDMFRMFLPVQGDTSDGYYEGNSLGTWDFRARYRLSDNQELAFAFQWPWEDGSGIGRRNGWDGLYGLYYTRGDRSPLTGVAIEYIDFRNQSGPIHWAPGDVPNCTITTEATGGDDYYNNETYGGYANYGLSLGSPFLLSPIYNTNGYSGFAHCRARGVHFAIKGCIGDNWDYTLKYSWQQAWGTGRIPATYSLIDNSVMIASSWNARQIIDGLRIDAVVAFDAGSLRGDNFGVLATLTYTGNLTFRK